MEEAQDEVNAEEVRQALEEEEKLKQAAEKKAVKKKKKLKQAAKKKKTSTKKTSRKKTSSKKTTGKKRKRPQEQKQKQEQEQEQEQEEEEEEEEEEEDHEEGWIQCGHPRCLKWRLLDIEVVTIFKHSYFTCGLLKDTEWKCERKCCACKAAGVWCRACVPKKRMER